ncbi:hypothetical protein ACET3Z_004936 [Daucus carota]
MHQQEDNYDAYPKEMDDDDVFDSTYCQNHEDGAFDEAYLFQTEEEAVDLEHEELKNLDIKHKVGKSWDIARRIINGPQREPFDDMKLMSLIYDLREANPDEDLFMHALSLELWYITVAVRNLLDEWELIIYTRRNGTFRLSVEFLKSFTVTELWVLRNKVKRSSNLNELLRDKLMEHVEFNSPQIVKNPYCLKFINDDVINTMYLNDEAFPKYPVNQLILASTLLQTKGFASKEKAVADSVISDYCLQNANEKKKRGEATTAEQPTREKPSTPILHSSDTEEGEVDLQI